MHGCVCARTLFACAIHTLEVGHCGLTRLSYTCPIAVKCFFTHCTGAVRLTACKSLLLPVLNAVAQFVGTVERSDTSGTCHEMNTQT